MEDNGGMEDGMRVEIVQEFTERYMKITVEEKAGDFGAEVLKYNEIDGILGAEVQQVDNEVQYFYEIGDRISLSELLRRGQFTVADVTSLMNQLIHIFEHAKEYFLDEKDVILMCECIFYDEKTKNISVAYLDGYGHEVGKGMSKLLEMCIDHMDHEDKELVFLLYGLHKISKEKNFCINRLSELIEKKGFRHVEEERDEDVKREKEPEVLYAREPQVSGLYTSPKEKPSFAKMAGYAAAGIFVFIAVFNFGLLGETIDGEPDQIKVMALALVLIVLVAYLIYKEWMGSTRGNGRGNNEQSEAAKQDEDDRTTLLADFCSDETVVLDKRNTQKFYVNLIPEDWQREEIKIRKSPFFIGKNAEKADGVIHEGDISRVHAKVVIEEDDVFVIDQESTNGTYVNGTRLLPWERRRIQKEDKIGFSSVYYRVELDL